MLGRVSMLYLWTRHAQLLYSEQRSCESCMKFKALPPKLAVTENLAHYNHEPTITHLQASISVNVSPNQGHLLLRPQIRIHPPLRRMPLPTGDRLRARLEKRFRNKEKISEMRRQCEKQYRHDLIKYERSDDLCVPCLNRWQGRERRPQLPRPPLFRLSRLPLMGPTGF